MHSDVKIGTCRYFRNNVFCPFEELGGKFLHSTDKSIELLKSISVNNSGHIENNFEKINFFTSTPRKLVVSESYQNMKETFECEGCTNKTQCSVCFVDAYIQKQKSNQKQCRICDSFIKIGDREFECGECDKFVCARCARETHISEEFFTCSPCLL